MAVRERKTGGCTTAVGERIEADLVNWDFTRKRFAATALEVTTRALIQAAQTPNIVTTTENTATTTTETTTSTTSTGTTTTTSETTTNTTTTSTTTSPNNLTVAALAQAIASLLSSTL